MRLTSMQFDCHFTIDTFIDDIVQLEQMHCIDMLCKINLSAGTVSAAGRNILTAYNRGLSRSLAQSWHLRQGKSCRCRPCQLHKIPTIHILHF